MVFFLILFSSLHFYILKKFIDLQRKLIKDGKQCWFDISNVRKEVEIYAKERDLSLSGIDEYSSNGWFKGMKS